MKPLVLFISSFFFLASIQAQELYFKAGLGYGIPQAGQTIDGSGNLYSGSVTQVSTVAYSSAEYKMNKVSFSAGLQAVLGAGIMLNKNIGVEVDAVAGLVSKKIAYTIDGTYDAPGYDKRNVSQQAKLPVFVCPALVLQTGDKLKLYARGGLVLPVNNKIVIDAHIESRESLSNSPVNFVTINQEIKTRFAVGFAGAMGVKYKLGKMLSVWGEAGLLSISLYTKKGTLTKYDVNGQDNLVKLKDEQKITNFELKNNTNDPANSNTSPAYAIPYSNFNITAGIAIEL
jgi:hypothetical protein